MNLQGQEIGEETGGMDLEVSGDSGDWAQPEVGK